MRCDRCGSRGRQSSVKVCACVGAIDVSLRCAKFSSEVGAPRPWEGHAGGGPCLPMYTVHT